jgi:SH3-like domain-containing protein
MRYFTNIHTVLFFFWALLPLHCYAVNDATNPVFSSSGLSIPRFVSLSNSETNVRVGPGQEFPINAVYKRAGLPVEVILEYDNWRKIRDYEGAEGWVYHSLLSGKRTGIIK